MDLSKAMEVAALGMKVQGVRMRVISENLAHANTTGRTPDEAPYRRQLVTFKNVLDRSSGLNKVEVDEIESDDSDFRLKYDPSHPAADERGYIRMPNVDALVEMMDMREAQRTYEANLGIIEMSKTMLVRTIDLLR